MINSKQLLKDFISWIDVHFGDAEMNAMVSAVLESRFNVTRQQLIAGVELECNEQQLLDLKAIANRINSNEPVQYILNEAFFYGRKFFVDQAVLIPRPETEELVSLVIDEIRKHQIRHPRIVDVGTGSGCIAITLAIELPLSRVAAIDKSLDALAVATKNAKALSASVHFEERDFLLNTTFGEVDVIVSNPPYIPVHERHTMAKNVTDYEPHLALFVQDNDPLQFYNAIAVAGNTCLAKNGFIAVEINERLGPETQRLFVDYGFMNTLLIKDISNKDRFVIARKN